MAPASLRLRIAARRRGVRAGRDVVLGRRVELDVRAGGRLLLGDGCTIGDATRLYAGPGATLAIGAGAVLGERCVLVAHAGVDVGERSVLGDGAMVVDFDHDFGDVERPIRVQPVRADPVIIGPDARIGLRACVLSGVTVGAGAVVGPHAVVTADVAPGAGVDGVPARPVAAT